VVIGAFAKLRKVNVSFVVSVCFYGSHCTDFHKILYLRVFRKSIEKSQVLLKSDNNSGYVT